MEEQRDNEISKQINEQKSPTSENKIVAAIIGTRNTLYAQNIEVIGTKVISTRPKPAERLRETWEVPHKNNDFVGRGELLRQIENYLNEKSIPLVLTALDGLGGVGKTQLALEFVWQHCRQYEGVAWFNAETRNQLLADYIRLGIEHNIIHQDDKDAYEDRALRVKHWLEDPQRAGWLLIYDNAPNYKTIGNLIPAKEGKVLVTSRYASGWPQGNIQVNVFTLEESRDYIKKVLGSKALDINQIDALAETLGHLPLALAQACAYIKKNPISIARYLEIYEKRKQALLSDDKLSKQMLGPDSNRAIVYITWDITREAVHNESLLANKWLTICAYLNSNNIPNFLLEAFAGNLENNPNQEIFETALGTLGSYSMLTINHEKSSASIHRLVQEVIRLKLKVEERRTNCDIVFELFKKCFPYGGQTSEDYTKKRQLLPHLEAFLPHLEAFVPRLDTVIEKDSILDTLMERITIDEQWKQETEKSMLQILFLMNDGYYNLGNWQKSWELQERSLEICERYYGNESSNTLQIRSNMALVLDNQGKYKDALLACQEVYDKSKDLLGPAHPVTLNTRHNMALVYKHEGKYKEALQAYQEVYDIRKDRLGLEDPHTLNTQDNMALVLNHEGKYKEALQTLEEVYDKRKDLLGPEHPDTLTTRYNIAGVLDRQGKYKEALQAYQEIYDKIKTLLGLEHPSTLNTQNNMAGVLSHQGKYKEALQAYQEVYDKRKSVLGPAHPDTLNTRNSMGLVLDYQGKYKEALQAYQEVYDERKNVLGLDHPDTLYTRNNMATVLDHQGEYDKALHAYQEVYNKIKYVLGLDHPNTLNTRNGMAGVLHHQGKCDEALQVFQEVYDKRKGLLGPAHPSTLNARNNMAAVFSDQGNYEEALQALQEVYDIQKDILGPAHPHTLNTRNNMSGVFLHRKKYEEALQALQEVYDIQKDILGLAHPNTLTTRNNMATTLAYLKNYEESVIALQEVYDIQKDLLGSTHPNTLNTRNNLATTLFHLGKYEEALQALQEVYDIQKNILGPTHPSTISTGNNLAALVQQSALARPQPGYEINDQLFVAVKNDDVQWVIDCIRGRANVDARDNNNWAPLHHAAEKGYMEIVSTLLQNRASINVENKGKATPLHFAARNGHIEVVEALLSNGATVDATTQSSNWTPLHFAAKQGHISIVKTLLKHGATYDARDNLGRVPMQLSTRPEIANLLNPKIVKPSQNDPNYH